MNTPAIEAEKLAQFERDKAAYDTLPRPQQHLAAAIAYGSIFTRGVIVTGGEMLLVASEFCFNVLFRWPCTLAARLVSAVANKAVAGLKLGVSGMTAAGRGAVSLAKDALGLTGRAAASLHEKGLLSQERRDKCLKKIDSWQQRLSADKEGIAGWGGRAKEKIDKTWNTVREKIRAGLQKTGEFLEYYGAIGLYRGTKWILDPRLPSGKPLFGNERVNKTVGLIAAGAIFVALSLEFSKLLVVGKIWHYKLAHAFFTSKAPFFKRFVKQAFLQPAIATGLASLKFVTLPIIAATRKTMKSTPFTQAIAYRYNNRLRAKHKRDAARAFAKAAAPESEASKKPLRRFASFVHQKSFGFVRSFVRHVIEKASPEFYEVRYRYYQEKRAAAKAEKEAADKPSPAILVPAPSAPAPQFAPGPQLGETFGQSSMPPSGTNDNVMPEAPVPEPKNPRPTPPA